MNTWTLSTLALLLLSTGVACTSDNPAFSAGQPCTPGSTEGCSGGTVCDSSGICVCPLGTSLCGDACADLRASPGNCGGCGLTCPSNETCVAGRCSGGTCAQGALECNGRCVDPRTNPRHCGGCREAGGRRCDDGEACIDGVCVPSPCPFGATSCAGQCVDLSSSPTNCGACGQACGQGQVCSHGACRSECTQGLTLCGSACVNTKKDPTNCGSCGAVCSKGETCAADEGKSKCQDYRFAGCDTCPCESCGERKCCLVADPAGGYSALCVEEDCPLP